MKENLENSIKNSLDNFELPYNAQAWNSMRAKLDAKLPVQKPAGRRINPYAAVATIAVISVASYFYFSQLPEEIIDQPVTNNSVTENIGSENNSQTNPSKINSQENSTQENVTQTTETMTNEVSGTNKLKDYNKSTTTQSSNIEEANKGASNSANSKQNTQNDKGTNGDYPTQNIKVIVPVVPALCINDKHQIKNDNKFTDLLVISPNGNIIVIPAKGEIDFKTSNTGTFRIGYKDVSGSIVDKSYFYVNPSPVAEFAIDPETRYEGGLPAIEVTSTTIGENYSWNYNGANAQGETAFARFYTKGNKTITLTVTNSNGCTDTQSKSIYIENDYNLMAVNAINTNSADPRNREFMPYALTERNVKFKMIIFDQDGRVVYETSSADQPWNGIDMKNGKEIDGTAVYSWKVQLMNPEPGERNVYQGTVTVIRN